MLLPWCEGDVRLVFTDDVFELKNVLPRVNSDETKEFWLCVPSKLLIASEHLNGITDLLETLISFKSSTDDPETVFAESFGWVVVESEKTRWHKSLELHAVAALTSRGHTENWSFLDKNWKKLKNHDQNLKNPG